MTVTACDWQLCECESALKILVSSALGVCVALRADLGPRVDAPVTLRGRPISPPQYGVGGSRGWPKAVEEITLKQ